jgi:hypothetical protein
MQLLAGSLNVEVDQFLHAGYISGGWLGSAVRDESVPLLGTNSAVADAASGMPCEGGASAARGLAFWGSDHGRTVSASGRGTGSPVAQR